MSGEYDVIIIGAGPGGLACAHELGECELSVLLLEKNDIIGPKTCAGGLKNLDMNFRLPVNRTRIFQEETFTTRYKTYTICMENPLKIISRHDLGQHQAGLLRGLDNVTIRTGTRVSEISENILRTNNDDYSFKYLVGADGAASLVRRHLGLETKCSIGMYYEVPEITERVIWHFDPETMGTGYAWAFPHLDNTNVGIYFEPGMMSPKAAKRILQKFMEENSFDYDDSAYLAAAIPHKYVGCVFDNIFLVGDAAGLAIKTTGGGISPALVSGQEIARKIKNPDYNMPVLGAVLRFKKSQENIFSFIERIPLIQRPSYRMMLNLMKKGWFQRRFGTYF